MRLLTFRRKYLTADFLIFPSAISTSNLCKSNIRFIPIKKHDGATLPKLLDVQQKNSTRKFNESGGLVRFFCLDVKYNNNSQTYHIVMTFVKCQTDYYRNLCLISALFDYCDIGPGQFHHNK